MTASKHHNDYPVIGRVAGAGGLAVIAADMLEGSRGMLQALQSGDTGEAE
jgi:hypothetical protein